MNFQDDGLGLGDPFGDDWPGSPPARRASAPPIWIDTGPFDPATIPARPWIIPGLLLRGTVTLMTGPGASGKSSVATAVAVAGSVGAAFGRFEPRAPFTTLVFNAEEGHDEQRRRIAAAAFALNVPIGAAAQAIVRAGPTETALLFEVLAERGAVRATPAYHALHGLIAERRPDLVVLDPLTEMHVSDENDNTALRAVVARLRGLAQAQNAALLLVHHARKNAAAGDQDGARGASAIASAARLHLTCTRMSREEAAAFALPEGHARHFIRLDSGKSNYAAPWEADWHELRPIELPNGDVVAAAVPWTPPAAPHNDADAQAKAEAALRDGWGGEPCSRSPNAAAYFGHAVSAAGLPRAAHAGVLAALIAANRVRERAWRDAGTRRVFRRLHAPGNRFEGWIGTDT